MLRTGLLGILLFLAITPLQAQFLPQATYSTGPRPFSLGLGDFNGDGIADLVVVNNGADEVGVANSVSVLLGNGDGTFQSQENYWAGYGSNSVITADLNQDGKIDLAVANGQTYTNQVFILLGNGDGSFSWRGGNWAGPTPQWLTAGDFDGDGNLDLAVASYGGPYTSPVQGGLYILLGNGDGTFEVPVYYSAGTNPFGVMAADFNHDGILDLAVLDNNEPFGVLIFLGNGDGTFHALMLFPAGHNSRVGVIADLNGDGNLDIAVGNCIDNNVSILLGDGTGYFAPPVNYAAGAYIQLLAGGDLNGDGKFDLVTANSGSNSVSVLLGNGDGTFQSPADFATGSSPMWVAVADFNGDNEPDLVVANSADNTVSVLLNKGTDFSISASATTPGIVTRGQNATATISLKLLTWFHNPVTLTYSVQPAESAPECSFVQNPVTFDDQGNATVTMTINAAMTAFSPDNRGALSFGWVPLVGLALIGAGFGSKRGARRKLTAFGLGVVLFGGIAFQAACGSGAEKIAQPPKTYTITVTGVSGSAQHAATTTIMVQ